MGEKDWPHICIFPRPETGGRFLHFLGLDTDCETYLHGEMIAEHHTMHLPLRLEVTDCLQPKNKLAVYFHWPHKLFRQHAHTMSEKWKGYFRRDCVVYACLERDGVQIARTTEFVDLERNLPFPQATLTLSMAGDLLAICTDAFAR